MRLAADANVLLSAVIGGRAKLILEHPKVEEVLTTEPTLAEVEEYALVLAKKKHLPVDTLILAVASLPVTIVERSQYLKRLPRALRLIRHRDPDDSELGDRTFLRIRQSRQLVDRVVSTLGRWGREGGRSVRDPKSVDFVALS